MTTQESKQQYEGAILNQLVKNAERIAVVERDISEMKKDISGIKTTLSEVQKTTEEIKSVMGLLKWIGGGVTAILLSILANFVYSFLS
ncbi:MAG: hypothetical protein QNJ65_02565 [Xenococcaceae cyanobacterium MO_234.B1]|nr:hypothetical protein [Xenococcaceae cyanobacterium MO_234.B1]